MRAADFDFHLPAELVAQAPAPNRDDSRLMVLRRHSGSIEHRQFPDLLEYLKPKDVLVLNNSRVIPARLRGLNEKSGGQFELFLLEEIRPNDWWVMLRPGKRARPGTRIVLRNPDGSPAPISATVLEKNSEGHRRVAFEGTTNILTRIDELGEVPLPPYIARPDRAQLDEDRERYQTTFAEFPGSVAAPTAGLHFTKALLDQIRARGVKVSFVTLHVGLGTFAPVKSEHLAEHTMHEERYQISDATAEAIRDAKAEGGRVFAVGTTTLRLLESVANETGGNVVAGAGRTRIFIYPPYKFKLVDVLLTNFHLPRSTLVMLVSAFAAPGKTTGREIILAAYAEAVRQRYRFYSYGDAMLIA
ncbi:MAG TPA: tRNA preQ1(34) S-adenosylmethionine ribosyltransferase-isomerase QueA [Verrucomicrobiae bacterium]|nr:tRNA preQ1(34) S-adenosylmethionine ribosyltransferase-isomerase QueA [Verrucomicrobiae bacterium]